MQAVRANSLVFRSSGGFWGGIRAFRVTFESLVEIYLLLAHGLLVEDCSFTTKHVKLLLRVRECLAFKLVFECWVSELLAIFTIGTSETAGLDQVL